MAYEVGAIEAELTLDKKGWDTAVKKIGTDQQTLTDKIKNNSAQIKQFGKSMTIYGAAILTGFGLITKKAIDANETISKFGTVFEGAFGAANKEVKNLTENYGLSTVESQKLLASTGDLLTGFGFTDKAALDLSASVNRMAVDLASFQNLEGGTTRASEALTKALLGETESAKSLGIVIRQDTKEFKGQVDAVMRAQGVTMQQAKALVILEEVTKQSKKAVGDFARTQHLAANQSRILSARFQDLIVDIGQKLVPIATSLITWLTKAITKISDWVKENPKLSATIIKITVALGALMVVIGPMLMVLPQIAAGFGMVKMAVMGVNPVILGLVAAVAALKLGFNALEKAQGRAMQALVDGAKKEKSEMEKFRAYKKIANDEDKKWIKDSMKRLTDEGRTQTEAMQVTMQALKGRSTAYKEFYGDKVKKEQASTAATKTNLDAEVVNFEGTATKEKTIQASLFSAMEKMRDDFWNAAMEKQLEFETFMQEQTMAQELLKVDGHNRDLLRLEQEYILKQQALKKQFTDEVAQKMALQQLDETYLLQKQELETQYADAKAKKDIEDAAKEKAIRDQKKNDMISSIMTITSMFQQAAQARMAAIDAEYENRRTWIEENVTDETEREKQLEALEDEFSAKKRAAARSAAVADKAAALAGAIVNTAQAVTKAYAQGGIFGFISAGLMLAAGAVQINAIRSQPIPLAEGGITQGPTSAIIGDNPGGKEAVIPLDRIGEVMEQAGESAGGGGKWDITIHAMDGASVERVFYTKIVPLIENATRTENLRIASAAVR